MSFLDRFFEQKNVTINESWKILEDEQQIDDIIRASHEKPVAIFKHSIRCGISSMAKYQLEENWDISGEELDFYYLDLINHRSVSNMVAEVFNIIHQSPQIIVVKAGRVVFSTTHHKINKTALRNAIESS